MLGDSHAFGGFSVRDVDAARTFYGDLLGLTTSTNEGGILTIQLGGGAHVIAYPKRDHEPAGFTILNFPVPDVDATVRALADRGIPFQRYPGMPQDEHGVMHGHGPTIAWFTDPSGNICSVIEDSA